MRILHVANSLLGAEPYGATELELDLRVGLECAVQAAILHGCDVLLHSGGLLAERTRAADHAWALTGLCQRLLEHGIEPVLFDELDRLHELGLPATVVAPGTRHEVRGLHVHGGLPDAAALESLAAAEGPTIAVAHGVVGGASGGRAHGERLDAEALAAAADACSYVALGGKHLRQWMHPRAWYAGQTAPAWVYDNTAPGGVVAQFGARTGALLKLTSVVWPRRKRRRLVIDACNMAPDVLAHVLHERLLEVLASASGHPTEHEALRLRLSAIDQGEGHDLPGLCESCRPVVHVQVRDPACPLGELLDAAPEVQGLLETGSYVIAKVDWGEGTQWFRPEQAAATGMRSR